MHPDIPPALHAVRIATGPGALHRYAHPAAVVNQPACPPVAAATRVGRGSIKKFGRGDTMCVTAKKRRFSDEDIFSGTHAFMYTELFVMIPGSFERERTLSNDTSIVKNGSVQLYVALKISSLTLVEMSRVYG